MSTTEQITPSDSGTPPDPDCIDVICVTDANYAPHFAALAKSIEQTKGPERVRVHVILDTVEQTLADQLVASAPGLEIKTYLITEHRALALPPLLQISRATYLRLIMEEILDPALKRVIYLDIDMIVTGSLRALWLSDLEGRPCAAVCDPGMEPAVFAQRFGLSGAHPYLNAGMLLIDLEAARRTGFLTCALEHLLEGAHDFEFADQDALNLVLWGNWTALSPIWNYQRKFLYDDFPYEPGASGAGAAPRIVHFTESAKPWQAGEWHPLAWLYWKYLRMTPFAAQIMARERVGRMRLAKFWLKYRLKGGTAGGLS
ncbi:hypothetical protein DL1_20155 [Thioclava dalianensis]|uniref:Glycosyl transferase n=1 Tax=Thioclava dalianensis TaxID=1185766 RepID=A0A074TJ02_9RHOB|nr:glycosyltransferase family 8 protein [Thioclava dalianensis]KEP70135.1 hypothetical protein DL1_20155 [Thioclava dalianensis]SFN51389.1 Lipopolysaccharide biosynthesis protein, LPS:glycosyltransferase [Thioclava dalianensis]